MSDFDLTLLRDGDCSGIRIDRDGAQYLGRQIETPSVKVTDSTKTEAVAAAEILETRDATNLYSKR